MQCGQYEKQTAILTNIIPWFGLAVLYGPGVLPMKISMLCLLIFVETWQESMCVVDEKQQIKLLWPISYRLTFFILTAVHFSLGRGERGNARLHFLLPLGI